MMETIFKELGNAGEQHEDAVLQDVGLVWMLLSCHAELLEQGGTAGESFRQSAAAAFSCLVQGSQFLGRSKGGSQANF